MCLRSCVPARPSAGGVPDSRDSGAREHRSEWPSSRSTSTCQHLQARSGADAAAIELQAARESLSTAPFIAFGHEKRPRKRSVVAAR